MNEGGGLPPAGAAAVSDDEDMDHDGILARMRQMYESVRKAKKTPKGSAQMITKAASSPEPRRARSWRQRRLHPAMHVAIRLTRNFRSKACDLARSSIFRLALRIVEATHNDNGPHISRMRDVVNNLEKVPTEKVFNNEALFARIMEYEGSLDHLPSQYSILIGWEEYEPISNRYWGYITDPAIDLPLRRSNTSRMFVCKRWFIFLGGSYAIRAAEEKGLHRHQKMIEEASNAKDNTDLPLHVRIVAMVVANDVGELRDTYNKIGDASTVIGEAIQSFMTDERAGLKKICKIGHPFSDSFLTLWNSTRLEGDGNLSDFHLRCASIAARCGSTQVLEFYQNRLGTELWSQKIGYGGYEGRIGWYDARRTIIKDLVSRVCVQPLSATQTKILDGIRQLLNLPLQETDIETMCSTNCSSGPLLHHAAASGCLELVQILVEKGIPPSSLYDGRSPVDWARKRRWSNELRNAVGDIELFRNYDKVIAYLEGIGIDGTGDDNVDAMDL